MIEEIADLKKSWGFRKRGSGESGTLSFSDDRRRLAFSAVVSWDKEILSFRLKCKEPVHQKNLTFGIGVIPRSLCISYPFTHLNIESLLLNIEQEKNAEWFIGKWRNNLQEQLGANIMLHTGYVYYQNGVEGYCLRGVASQSFLRQIESTLFYFD